MILQGALLSVVSITADWIVSSLDGRLLWVLNYYLPNHFLNGGSAPEEIRDSSLFLTSMKYGKDAPILPAAKLIPGHQLIYKGVVPEDVDKINSTEGVALKTGENAIHFTTVPGDSKATVIQPVPILRRIFKKLAMEGKFNEDLWGKKAVEDAKEEMQCMATDYGEITGEGA